MSPLNTNVPAALTIVRLEPKEAREVEVLKRKRTHPTSPRKSR